MPRLLGQKIAYVRGQHHISQATLAQMLGTVKQSHVSNVETGRREPSLAFVVRCAEVLRVTVEYLVRDAIPVEAVAEMTDGATIGTGPIGGAVAQQFGAKLRYQREQRGWSQADLTRHLAFVSQAQISRLEATRKLPSIELVLQCADLFDLPVDYWVRDKIAAA